MASEPTEIDTSTCDRTSANTKAICAAASCSKEATHTCSRCKVTKYCSRECQTQDWKEGGHKTRCQRKAKGKKEKEVQGKPGDYEVWRKPSKNRSEFAIKLVNDKWHVQRAKDSGGAYGGYLQVATEDDKPAAFSVKEVFTPDMFHQYEDFHSVGEKTIRAKWMIDGAATLSEAAEKLRRNADWLEELEKGGWQFQNKVADDYGFARIDVAPIGSRPKTPKSATKIPARAAAPKSDGGVESS